MGETTMTLDPPLRACWMKVGQQKRIAATQPSSKPKRHVFGGYDCANNRITYTLAESENSEVFIRFLEQLLVKEYPKLV